MGVVWCSEGRMRCIEKSLVDVINPLNRPPCIATCTGDSVPASLVSSAAAETQINSKQERGFLTKTQLDVLSVTAQHHS